MPVPVQIYDQGRLIRFRSKRLFLDLLGWSHTYMTTGHYKQKHGDETLQQLWDRTGNAHARLEAFMRTNKSEFDAVSGMQSFRKGRIIVYPYGYEDVADPHALKEFDSQTLGPSSLAPNGAPVASGTVMSHPVFDAMVHFFIDKAVELYVAGCKSDAVMEAHVMYDSIRALRLDESQQRVASVNNDPDHALVSMLNDYCEREKIELNAKNVAK